MLKLLSSENQVLQVDDFYVLEKSSGLDELVFNIPIYDGNYPHILEEAVVEYEQPYLVKAVDASSDYAKVKCQLDLDALKADMLVNYSNNSNTLSGTINAILPAGWFFVDDSGRTIRRTIEGDYTPYEVIAECADTYDVVFRFKPKQKMIYAYSLENFRPLGAFASRELNLKEINYKGKSSDLFTRLYAFGADDLSFADINDGKNYVDCFDYTDKIICAVMRDERYTTKDGLLEAAQKAVKKGAVPSSSYECTVYDLAAVDPDMYSFQDFSLFSVIRLIDDIKKTSVDHQVVEYKRYPKYPEKNVVTLSTTATKLQNTVKNLQNEIENPQSAFRVTMLNLINSIAGTIAGFDGGNLITTLNTEGKPNGLMIMDTESQETATKVLWLNLNGITYSANGVNGPYDAVWSFAENGFIADWLAAGTIQGVTIIGEAGTIGGLNMSKDRLSVGFEYTYPDFTSEDVQKIQDYVVGSGTLTDEEKERYDLNFDGHISVSDAYAMQQMISGTIKNYTKGIFSINPGNLKELISIEVTEGYRAGETLTLGIGGLRTMAVQADRFYIGEKTGTSKTVEIGDVTLEITGGLITGVTTA